MLFAAFAFVVLLGTVFPLVVEAVQRRAASRSGAPYFDRMTMPIGLALLFLMAVAPVLPWRKASGELLRQRLLWPAWIGAGVVVLAVLSAPGGLAPLLAFGLGGFAAGSACASSCSPPAARAGAGWSAAANGGMIVHLGVVIIAVALAASSVLRHRASSGSRPASRPRSPATPSPTSASNGPRSEAKTVTRARVQIDGGQVYAPALSAFPGRHTDDRHAVGAHRASPRTSTSRCSTCPTRTTGRLASA